jgi:uncharacterized protein YkwD
MTANGLELQSRLQGLPAGGSGLSPLTTANTGFLTNNRSPLSEPLQQTTTLRASASAAAVTPEPGNTRGTAYNIGALGATPSTVSDAVGVSDRNDYYQLSIGTKSNFSLALTGLTANANVQFLSATGAILSQSVGTGTANEAINRILNPGTYYVRVYQVSGNTTYTLGLAATPISSNATPNPGLTPTPTSTSDFGQQVLDLTNQFRAQNGLAPLRLNTELNAAALTHSKNMALQDFFSHTGKDGSTVGDRLKTVGYESQAWGENIAAGYATPDQVVQSWINSPGHRANLLNRSYTELGVGYYYLANDTGSVNYKSYWTQDFGAGDRNPSSNLPA